MPNAAEKGLSVNIPSSISFDAYIEVEFPQPYQLSSPCVAYIKSPDSDFATYSCTKEEITKYVVAVGTITAGDYYIAFEGITNPGAYLGSSNFKIRTYQNEEVLVDSNEFLDAVPFLPYPATSNNASIENLGYTNVNLGSKFDFTFSLTVALEKGDSIKFNFPSGFSFVKPACFHRNSGSYAIAEVLHNNRMVICHQWPEAMATNTWQVVSIIGVVNPEYSGFFRGFYLETLQGFSSYVYEQVNVPGPVHIYPGSVNVAVRSASLLMTTNTTHVFDLLFEDDVKSDAQIWIKLPPGFRYMATNCTLLRTIEPQTNGEVTCGLAANKTGYIIEGFAKISASQLVSVKVSVENPPVAVAYKVQIFSYSTLYNAQIDEAYTSITIQNNYGSSKFFKSHALEWTTRLGHGETGALEFTFFLNIPLPATYSTFEGHLIVDIRPQIPTPPIGTLRCFFYNTVPAESCTWDVSDPTKTRLTIYTPTTETYYQTEIPITITTEDAVGTYGIQLPELIQRYKFYFYFFRNGELIEHEVYFEDYVPDPIVMDSTWLTTGFYPTQYGEESYLQIEWTNLYMDLDTNYFVELSFDHSNQAWDYNLGWGAQAWYGRYDMPCLVDGLGSDYKCILIPGGAAGTQSIIQIIGLSTISSVSPNNVYTFRLPKIKFGTPATTGAGANPTAYMTFTLYQNTPGENTNKIPIMYMINTYTPSAASTLTTTTFTTLSVTPNQPDVDSTLSIVFGSVTNPDYTIFEYPSLFTIDTKEDTCGSSNPCYIFSDPVRWIVFAPSPLQGATVTASHAIHTAPYTGSYTFKARTDLNQVIGNKKSQAFTLSPGALTVTFTADTTNAEINENSLVLFDVGFTTITQLPDDGSVVLTFAASASLTIPTRDDFYCEVVSGLTGYSTVGVICELYTTTKIRLYNLAATAASTAVSLKVVMKTATTAALPLTVTTYYDRSATKIVDTGSRTLTLTYQFDNFAASSIENDRSGKIVRVNTYGGISFTLTPTNTYTAGTMFIYFATGFTLSSTTTDVLYCKIGTIRRRCTVYATTPLTVRIPSLTATDLTANTAKTVFITTDYADNTIKGIKAPTTPGDKYISIKLQNAGTDMEQIGKYIYVYPASIPEFQVFPTTTTASAESLYKFEFSLKVALPSQTSTATKGRILIEFPVGTASENYLTDLGTGYTNSGAELGCVVSGLTTSTSLGCRLLNAPSSNYPAQVEITGFNAITAVPATIIVYVAKVLNPAQTLSEYTYNLKTESVVVSTGVVTPLEFTTYSLWNRATDYPSPLPVYTSGTAPYFVGTPLPNQSGASLYVSLYSNVALSVGDYYVLSVPTDIVLADTLTCPTYCDLCLSFPNIGWVVYRLSSALNANTNYDGTIRTVTLPASLDVAGYTITAYIWKNGELNHEMLHQIAGSGSSAVGTFNTYTIVPVNTDEAVRARTNLEVKVQFTCQSKIPATGSIEIRFPSDVTPLANCRNSISGGSGLTSATGRVACEIQNNAAGYSWVLTNFDAVAASTVIVVSGYVTLPDAVGTTGYFKLYSYGNQDDDLATNGHPIDRLATATTYYLNVLNNYKTLTLDVNPTININTPMRAAATNYKPLMFDFSTYSTAVTSSYSIAITVDAPTGSSFGNTIATNAQRTCYFVNKGTGAITACSVTVSGTAPLVYSLVPSETLAASTSYRGVITTVFANAGNDGVLQPSTAGVYRIGMTVLSGATTVEADMDFYEVYPSQFTTLTVKNYIMSKGDEDIIDITLTVPTAIGMTDRLIIELPTLYNSTSMFATDLGSGFADGDDKKCELISSTPTITMSCYLQKGNIYAGTPATIVVYGFSAAFTALRFAFTAVNPSVTTSTALPITIYSLTGTTTTFTKTYYQTVEKAIVVLDPTITATNIATQPTWTSYQTSTSSSLTISIYFAAALTTNDYYIIKTHKLGSASTVQTGTLTISTDTAATYITLPKNQLIILKPSTSIASTTTSVTIPNLYTPDNGLGSGALSFSGYSTYFSTFASGKVTYSTAGSDFTKVTFTSNPTVTLDGVATATTRQQSLMTITVSTYFASIQSLIINVPSQLTLGNDCYDFITATTNVVQILQCTTDTTNNRIYVTLEANTYSSTVAYSMIIKAPVTNSATAGAVSTFDFYAYSAVVTDPTTATGLVYSVPTYNAALTLSAGTPDIAPPTFIEAEYVPYVENKDSFPTGTTGELRFQFELPAAVDSTGVFTIQLPSSTYIAFTADTTGDINAKPAVIIYDTTLTGSNILVLPTYASNTLTFSLPSGVTLASGRTPNFKVTQIARSGENIGLTIQSAFTPKEIPLYMTLVQSSTTYIGLLGNLYVSLTANSFAASLTTTLTRAENTMNLWEFSFTFGSSTDNLYLDFPTYDEYGNALFAANLGGLSDQSSIPCTSTTITGTNAYNTYSNPECIFIAGGTNAQPARIWIRGFAASTGAHTFILVGPQNPAALRRLYINARFYSGTTFQSIVRINGYETVASSITTQAASGSYQVSSDYYYAYTSAVTTTFTTAVSITSGNYILVKLDSDCTTGSNTGGQYIATGDIGTYVFQKASSTFAASYTFSNFKCSTNNGLSFVEYHITSITGATGEIRTSDYTITTAKIATDSLVTLSSSSTANQILSYYRTGATTQMKIQFDIAPLDAEIDSSSYLLVTFRDTTNGYYNYLASVSSCTVLGGLIGASPDKKVSCDVYSTYSVLIYGVSEVSGDISLLLGGTTYSGTASTGPIAFTLYADSTKWAASEYYQRATQTVSTSTALYNPTYTFSLTAQVDNTIYFDDSNDQTLSFYVEPSSFSTSFTTNSDYITIYFDTFDSSKYILGADACTFTNTYYSSCTVDIAAQTVTLYVADGSASTDLTGVYLSITTTMWRSNPAPYFFRATYTAGSVGTFYPNGYTYTFTPSANTVVSPFSAVPLHLSVDAYTEYAFTITSASDVITLDTNSMVSVKYTALSNRQSAYAQIDCICLQGSSQISASCYNYINSEKSFDIMFASTVSFGSDVTCYIPDIQNPSSTGTTETLEMRIMDRSTRTIYMEQTLSALNFNSLTSDDHILDIDVSTTITVGTTANSGSFAVSLDPNSYSYPTGSYLYVDFQQTGLKVPTPSDLTKYRVYSTVRNIYVSYLAASSGSGDVSLFTATQILAASLSTDSSDYQPISYVSDGTEVVSLATTTISYTMEPTETDVTVTVDQALRSLQALMHISFSTGTTTFPNTGVLHVTLGGVSNLDTVCYASIGYKEATCSVSSSVLTITFSSAIAASTTVDILIRANNPASTLAVTVEGYSSYTSASVNSQVLSSSTTLNSPTYVTTPTATSVMGSSKMNMLSFTTKTIVSTAGNKAPLRIKFKMTSALTKDTDIMKVTLPSGQYTASTATLVCSFRTYTSTFESEFTENIVSQVIAPTFASSVITVSPGATLAANTNHELVCVVSDYTGFTILSAANQKATVTFSNSGSTTYYASSTFRLYQYQATPSITLTKFYFTSKYSADPNALVFTMQINTALTAYPNRRIEIELPSASSNLIGSGWASSSRNLPCGFSTTSLVKRTSSSAYLRCTFVQGTVPKIRIENYAALAATNTFQVIIYDLANSVIAQDFVKSFDAHIVVTDEAANTQSRHKWRRGFPLETATSLMQTSTGTFPTSSTTFYATSATLTKSTVPWSETTASTKGRFLIRAKNTDWKFGRAGTTAFTIGGTTQTNVIVDTVNQIMFVPSASATLTSGGSYTFTWTNILSPLPYETNGGSYVMEYYSTADGVNAYYRQFTFSGTYTTLTVSTATAPTITCSTPVSGKNGKIDCSMTISFTSTAYSLQGLQVDFPTAAQYTSFYPYCQAWLTAASVSSASKKQLSCSRLDTSSSAGSASFFITGFTYVSGTSNVVFSFKAKVASTATLTTSIYSKVLSSGTYYTVLSQVSQSLNIAAYLSTTYFAPSTFSTQNYYEQALQASAKKPFRFAFTNPSAISAGGSLLVTLGTTTSYAPTANTLLMCTLRDQTTFAAPYVTVCSYASGVYTLKLVDALPASRYLVELTNLQQDMSSEGFSFPTVTAPATMDRVSVKVQVIDSTSTTVSIDSTYLLYRAPAFSTFAVTQRNKIGGTASQFQIDFSLAAAVPSDGTTEYLMYIEFPTSYYDSDLGASSACHALDGNPYYNGIKMPSVFGTSFSTGQGSLQYAQLTDNPRVIISKHSGFTTATQNINIAYVKNPTAYKAATMNIYIVRFDSTKTYPVIVYQANYINYFSALLRGTETNTAPTLSFTPFTPQQTATMTFSKNFGTTAGTTSKIYFKLREEAVGFDYTTMLTGSIACPGYTVTAQWHKDGFMFFLVPTATMGPTVSVVCTGFTFGSDITDLSIETGIHREGSNLLYNYISTPTMSAYPTATYSTQSIVVSGGTLTNPQSVNLFTVKYNPGLYYTVKATSYILITIPSGFAVIPGVTEKVTTYGFTDYTAGSPSQAVNAYLSGSNLVIAGYSDFTNMEVSVSFYLKNVAVGTYSNFALSIYSSSDVLTAYSGTFGTITVDSSTPSFVSGTFGPYETGDVPLYATEVYPIILDVTTKTTLTSANGGAIRVTLPTGFTQTPDPVCKYSTDSGDHWIWSTCSVSGSEVTFSPLVDFDINAGVSTLIMLCTDSADIEEVGITRPTTTSTYYKFQVESLLSTVTQESTFIPFVLYPMPGTLTLNRWYTRGNSDYTVIEFQFTSDQALQADDFFQIDFVTYDDIVQVYANDLGTGTTEKSVISDCARDPSSSIIASTVNINCYITPGKGTTATPFIPATLKVSKPNTIAANQNVNFFVAKIKNPTTGIPGGFVFNVMRKCRSDGYGCPIFRKRDYAQFGISTPKVYSFGSRPTLLGSSFLFEEVVSTQFQLTLTSSITNAEGLTIVWSTTNIEMTNDCTTSNGICIHFPRIGWTFFQPTTTLATGIRTFALTMDNAFFYDRTNTLTWIVNTYHSSGIQQQIESYHPDYSPMLPTLSTDATQTDQANQYIVRNFDNILQLSMTEIWRTELTSRIIVNTPPSYATLNASYCHAGVDVFDISDTDYIEFPCRVTGDRQITIIITEDWVAADATRTVVVFYRGFESLAMATGTQTPSTITSYASITTNWVIDENTGYTFYVSPTPTPIVRDLNLNHDSFYDRLAKINDYVVLYTAVWPNTPVSTALITQMIFQLADEFIYPSLSNLVCITKAVFREIQTCTLKREQGRTLIYVNTPSNYDNGPFLLTITNTAENLLFIAPDREGSFLFNVTYLDASGNVVETSDSYIGIQGEEITFSAEPILIDPLTPTVMDIKFTTTSRVTPQGYVDSTQESSTQIVILFQTYDPAYPLDLGTGLVTGSYISCLAAAGITVNKQGELLCQLIIGTVTDHSKIIITNYDAIPANSDVEIMIDIIPTLAVGIVSRIGFEIDSTYTDDATGSTYSFYTSLVVSPQASTASTANAAAALTVTRTGSDTLRSTSTYTFTFTTTAALTANSDYFIINLPDYSYQLESDYSDVTITISSPSTTCQGFIMPKTNNIYVRPTANVAAGSVTLTIQDLPNPSFYLSGTQSITVQTIVSSKTKDVFTDSAFSFTSTLCQLFSSVQITYDSTFIRVNENTYKFSFTIDHIVPADGSIAIVFDPTLYKLNPSNPVCELISGFSSSATCAFEVFDEQLVRVHMNGVAIESGTAVSLSIIGVNNPTDSTTAPVITIRSYFDDEFASTKEICSVDTTLPKFSANSLINCPIDVLPEVANAGMTTDYLVTINCAAKIRNGTTINIQFPPEYESLIPSTLTCATSGNYLLIPCSQVSGTAQINVFITTPNNREALVIRIRGIQNPALSGTYTPYTTQILQYSILYAQPDSTSTTTITIKDNFKLTQADDKLVLSILPTNFGEKSTHFFSLKTLTMQTVPDNLIMVFDSSYPRELGSNLVCGTFTPNNTFGTSLGLNYETIRNYKTFPCTVIDDHKLQLTISSAITIQANTALDFFIFIQNIVNPSLTDQTSFTYTFNFIASGAAVFTATNTPIISFGLPPSLLHATSITTSDSNLRAPAIYTFNLEATTHLPSAISDISMDYELQVNLPSAEYPDFSQGLQVVYSFPDNTAVQEDSSAFNYFNEIFFTANYPDLYDISPLKLVLSNMSNPDVESYCGFQASGSPVKFDLQYVSRKQNSIYARSYNIMDQHNCLPIGKKRDAIKVIAPYYLRQGLVYNITVSVEEGAAAVTLTPLSTFLLFNPVNISFVDYESSSTTINVIVARNAPKGDHRIKWKKTETSGYTNYLEVEDTQVIVVDESASEALTPKPQVNVEDIKYVWTGKEARDVLITLDYAPAENVIVKISTKYTDTKLKGSVDGGVTYSSFPIYLSFSSGQVQNTFYIQAETDAKDNVFTYSLTGTNALAYNPKIVNSPFVIKTQAGLSNYQIISTDVVTVLENQVSYNLTVSGVGTIYYLALVSSSILSPTKDQIISGTLSGVDSQYYISGKVDVLKMGLPFAYTTTVTISDLESQTKYQVYFIARSAYGEYSSIASKTFTTLTVNEGVSILIPTFRNASIPNLLDAISMIIPVARSRLVFTEADTFPVEDRTAIDLSYGDQLNGYRITLSPDANNNDPSPLDLANELFTDEKQAQLLALIPQFYPKAGIKITPLRRISPRIMVKPSLNSIGYYSAEISLELIEVGRLFAIAAEVNSTGKVKPTSYQISKGLLANNVQLDERYYKQVWTATTGKGTIVFDELKEYTDYNIYITAGNDLPYASLDIMKDDETLKIQLQTLKNPNVGTEEYSQKLYDEYNSASRIGSMLGTAILLLLTILFI